MKRLVLRNGFTLRAHEGVGHLTDVRTGDALLVPASHLVVLESALRTGVDPTTPAITALLGRYGAFLTDAPAAPAPGERSFYELDDAPTIPPVRPEEVQPRPESSHRVLAVVAPPSEPSADWQLHGDAAKRADTPTPTHPDEADGPWKVREPAASSPRPSPASAVPPVAPLVPSASPPRVPPVSPLAPAASEHRPTASSHEPAATLLVPTASPPRVPPVSSLASEHRPTTSSHEPVATPLVPTEHRSTASSHEPAAAPLSPTEQRSTASSRVPPASSLTPAASSEHRPTTSLHEPVATPLVPTASPPASPLLAPTASEYRPTTSSHEPAATPLVPTASPPRIAPVSVSQSRAPSAASPPAEALQARARLDVPSPRPSPADVALYEPPDRDPARVPVSSLSAAEELSRALEASDRQLNETAREPTSDAVHLKDALARGAAEPVPTAEAELRHALETAQQPPPPAEPPSHLSQEENLRSALEQSAPAPQTREEVAALLESTAQELGVTPPAAPVVAPPAPARAPASSGRVVGLAVTGVALLAASVGVSFWLRTRPEPTELPAFPDAGVAVQVVDAGAPVVNAPVDAGVAVAMVELDAGVAELHDAGALDAGVKGDWFEATVQARGRVKMADALARADGVVTWAVAPEQRVKTKQVLGKLTRADGTTQDLVADSVGLAMLSLESGASVKSGAVLAEIIYFEAWAKGVVRGATPTPAWRCEVVSESLAQRADCKISVVTPRPGGAQVTVAIEPRWFDGAADAVLRLAP